MTHGMVVQIGQHDAPQIVDMPAAEQVEFLSITKWTHHVPV